MKPSEQPMRDALRELEVYCRRNKRIWSSELESEGRAAIEIIASSFHRRESVRRHTPKTRAGLMREISRIAHSLQEARLVVLKASPLTRMIAAVGYADGSKDSELEFAQAENVLSKLAGTFSGISTMPLNGHGKKAAMQNEMFHLVKDCSKVMEHFAGRAPYPSKEQDNSPLARFTKAIYRVATGEELYRGALDWYMDRLRRSQPKRRSQR